MTQKHLKHECCPNAAQFLRGYPCRSEPGKHNWHLLGIDRYVLHCPWCGCNLEYVRKAAAPPLRAEPGAGE